MAETVLTIALETVRDLLIQEAKFLYGVRGEVEEIERALIRMNVFLEYADSKQEEDKMLHLRVAEIRGISDEVGDVLETFAIEVESRRRRGGVKNALKRYACIFNECIALHKVGSEIVIIKTRITNLTSNLPLFVMPKGESSNSTHEKNQRWQRQTFPHLDEDIVGMEENIRQLVFHVVNNNNEETQKQYRPRVVSICGMGGIGKTSLAKKVYNHNEVRRCFDHFSWTCITQNFQPRDVLQEILIGLVPMNRKQILDLINRELVELLHQVLVTNKCLIILDDIWTIDAWDSLKLAFPEGKSQTQIGSKVLLTTRNKKVALHADPSGFLHELRCLDEEESWILLKKKAFPTTDIGTDLGVDPRMEKVGREMVSRCKGLPLAVIVLGGILVTKHTFEEWETVLQNIKTYLTKGEDIGEEGGRGVSDVLALSYKNLTYQLKRCFLYFCNFPEDSEIETRKLYHMWVAEGIISSDYRGDTETMVDVAQRHLWELAQRCMVQVQFNMTWTSQRRFKSCRLHDLMRDLCLLKVKEGNFLKVSGKESMLQESSPIRKIRRVSRYSNYGEFTEYCAQYKIVTLSCFRVIKFSQKTGSLINDFKSLRVLDLEGTRHVFEPEKVIGMLKQLRYLCLRNTKFNKLPSSLGNLGYLQTLDIRSGYHPWIPNVLWKLQRLRHLYLPKSFGKDRNKLRLDSLSNLETLINFHPYRCDVKGLPKLNTLRELKVNYIEEIEDLRYLATTITSKNPLLQHSDIRLGCYKLRSEEEIAILRKLLDCHHLHNLSLMGPISHLLEHYHFPPSLTKLELLGSKFVEDPMPILEKLPSLTHLIIGLGAFSGKEMVCSSIGFPHLTLLELSSLIYLEDWRVNEGAFSKLSHMKIDGCEKLKMIPDGLTYITTLKELSIAHMHEEFNNRVRVVNGIEGEDFHKVRHVPSIKITEYLIN